MGEREGEREGEGMGEGHRSREPKLDSERVCVVEREGERGERETDRYLLGCWSSLFPLSLYHAP